MNKNNISFGDLDCNNDDYKIREFIENLNDYELVELWRIVNSPEYLCLIAGELNKLISKQLTETGTK